MKLTNTTKVVADDGFEYRRLEEEADYKLWQSSPEHYELLTIRDADDFNEKRRIFMGDEYAVPPLPHKEELVERAQHRADRLKRLYELKAPQLIIDSEQHALEIVMAELNEKRYLMTKEEIDYRVRYNEKLKQFKHDREWLSFDYEGYYRDGVFVIDLEVGNLK